MMSNDETTAEAPDAEHANATPSAVEPEASSDDGGARATMPAWKIAIFALLAFAGGGLLAGLGVLFLSGDENAVYATQNRPGGKTPHVDALVTKATGSKFELRTRGGKRVTMYIRKPDRPYLDVLHAQSHAALGQPVRVYYRTEDGKKYAIYLEDSAVLF